MGREGETVDALEKASRVVPSSPRSASAATPVSVRTPPGEPFPASRVRNGADTTKESPGRGFGGPRSRAAPQRRPSPHRCRRRRRAIPRCRAGHRESTPCRREKTPPTSRGSRAWDRGRRSTSRSRAPGRDRTRSRARAPTPFPRTARGRPRARRAATPRGNDRRPSQARRGARRRPAPGGACSPPPRRVSQPIQPDQAGGATREIADRMCSARCGRPLYRRTRASVRLARYSSWGNDSDCAMRDATRQIDVSSIAPADSASHARRTVLSITCAGAFCRAASSKRKRDAASSPAESAPAPISPTRRLCQSCADHSAVPRADASGSSEECNPFHAASRPASNVQMPMRSMTEQARAKMGRIASMGWVASPESTRCCTSLTSGGRAAAGSKDQRRARSASAQAAACGPGARDRSTSNASAPRKLPCSPAE